LFIAHLFSAPTTEHRRETRQSHPHPPHGSPQSHSVQDHGAPGYPRRMAAP
jgi:hypothetical protein